MEESGRRVFSAWGDESGSVPSRDPDIYLMGAVLAAPEAVPDLRAAMVELQRRGEKKIHWRADSDDRHDAVIGVIAQLPLEGVVVVRHGWPGEKDDRRRRKCFETFAPELVAAGCTNLVLESRGSKADQRDHNMLGALRSQQRLDGALRLDHAAGPADPVLWIADAVCGALVASRVGNDRWWAVVEKRMTVHQVGDAPRT